MQIRYPLKFKTLYKDKIWGGDKIRSVLGKDYGTLPNCGETWELSGVPGNVSVVSEGPLAGTDLNTLIADYGAELMGGQVLERFGKAFPLLVKFIDANDDLSIQVHPDDELAQKRHNSFGKTEMWYIFQADEGAALISGFKREISRQTYLQHLEARKLDEILNYEQVQEGDVFFMPAGRVHSIGKGCLLAEIQQTSDVTYRIYDFDRRDAAGNLRELHTEEALDAIDYNHYPDYKSRYQPQLNQPVTLASCPYFQTQLLHYDKSGSRDYAAIDSFVILVCCEGSLLLHTEAGETPVSMGEVVLLPAALSGIRWETPEGFRMLESFVPAMKI